MPKAVGTTKTQKFDLKSLPGGFVELRKMSYGEILHRRDIAADYSPGQGKGQRAKVTVNNMKLQAFEFAVSIVDHNLEDEDGSKLDFKKADNVTKLDSNIAQEIEKIIEDLNEEPEESKSGMGESGEE